MGESVGRFEAGGATPWATQAAKAHSVQVWRVRVQVWEAAQMGHSGARAGHRTQRARRLLRLELGVRLSLSSSWGPEVRIRLRVRAEERLRWGEERIFIYRLGWCSCLEAKPIGCSLFSLGESRKHETTRVSPILMRTYGREEMRMNGYMRATANVRCFFNAEAAELSLMQERRCRGIKSPRYGGAGPGSGSVGLRHQFLLCFQHGFRTIDWRIRLRRSGFGKIQALK